MAGAVTYRTFGCEKQRGQEYERCLADYEKRAVRSGVQASALQPLYQALAMTGAGFILWFGSQNVQGVGHAAWDIGMLTTFLACYAKLARKASHAAKLFNAVQKARVSWRRIRPFLKTPLKDLVLALETSKGEKTAKDIRGLEARRVSFSWNAEKPLFEELTFTAKPGQIVGVTGPVACGKPSLGQIFCGDVPYGGSIRLNGREPREMKPKELHSLAVWQGHDSMLLADSIRENVQMGEEKDVWPWLKAVCMDREVAEMENGADTAVGSGGIRLSGGQQERLALARTLAHGKEVIVLDDPFASLDRMTEEQVFANVRELSADRIVLLISHRLYLFPQLDQVIWMADGRTAAGSHEELMKKEAGYAALYRMQMEGGAPDEA